MADEKPKLGMIEVEAIDGPLEFIETHGVIPVKIARGSIGLAFTASQIDQLVWQLPMLLGRLKGDVSVVRTATECRVGQTLGDALRLDFTLPDDVTFSVSLPMSLAGRLADQIREEEAKGPALPPGGKRH